MKSLIFALLFFSATMAYAQIDRGNNILVIPPMDPPPAAAPKVSPSPPKKDPFAVPPSIKGEPSGNRTLDLEESVNFGAKKPEFVSRGQEIADKMNERVTGSNLKDLRKDTHYGEFRVESKKVVIRYKDIGRYVDGEQVGVIINDKQVMVLYIEGDMKTAEVMMEPGFNKLDLKVLNMGMYYPSSIFFEVLDEKGRVLATDTWFAETNFKATLVIVSN